MGNRPHPYRRGDAAAMERAADAAFPEGSALDAAERAARIAEYENSPEQADWDADETEESPDPWGDALNWWER